MSSYESVPGLPASLKAQRQGAVGTLWLARSEKRNALDDRTILGIETYFSGLAEDIKAVVLAAEGADFSAGLDLGEIKERGISALLMAPVLFLTLMLGPLGFLLYLVLRDVAARSFGGRTAPEPSGKERV